MWELRWVLLGLGALLVVCMYLWGRGLFGPSRTAIPRFRRAEPRLSKAEDPSRVVSETDVPPLDTPAVAKRSPSERIVALRFIPKRAELDSKKTILALREAGLRHGRYGIFHHLSGDGPDDPIFSVANLTEPGSFDLERLDDGTLAGMTFFIVLPGSGDPVARFDAMVQTAHSLARELDAELYDDRGSSWSIQRERYVREEVIEYRHQLERR